MLILHRDRPGYDKIESGKYIVSDEDGGGALVPRESWRDTVKPGRQIGLSFLLKHPGADNDEECPRCRADETKDSVHVGQKQWCVVTHRYALLTSHPLT